MKSVRATPLPSATERPGAAENASPVTPAQSDPPRSLRGQLETQRDELAREIAHEVSAGDWVPWTWLSRYRTFEQRLEDFAEQMRGA